MILKLNKQYYGSMLTDRDAVTAAMEILKEEDFYREDNRNIYSAMVNLYSRAEPIDIITVKAELGLIGKFEVVGRFGIFSKFT